MVCVRVGNIDLLLNGGRSDGAASMSLMLSSSSVIHVDYVTYKILHVIICQLNGEVESVE